VNTVHTANIVLERIKKMKTITILSILIILLTLIVAGTGVFWQREYQPVQVTTVHGQVVSTYGRGLYQFESTSLASQAIAQDVITLILGIPLLVAGLLSSLRGCLRGKLVLTGTLSYFLYTYVSYAFGAAYNPLFLLYVALFTLSLYAFILSLREIQVDTLPAQFTQRLPRRGIVVASCLAGAFLVFFHLGRIIPALLGNTVPDILEFYTTIPISVLDVGLIAPTAFLAAILLAKNRPWGYLLSAIILIKGFTLTTAVSAMLVGQMIVGARVTVVEMVMFPFLTIVVVILTIRMLASLKPSLVASRGVGPALPAQVNEVAGEG
jgi:hypothetical protein